MELNTKQKEELGKTFLDVFKLLIVGLLITDFIFQASLLLKLTVAIAAIGFLIIGTILYK